MKSAELIQVLERIAIAVERIADSVAPGSPPSDIGASIRETIPTLDTAVEIIEEDAAESTPVEDVIGEFLASKNITIKFIPPEDAADDVINSLAVFLGTHYNALSELLSKIKSNMQIGGLITLAVKDYQQKDRSDTCQFCTRLHDIAFLEQYKYWRSPQYIIKAKTTTLPSAQNFFSGKWLERFVLQTVQQAVAAVSTEMEKELDFSYLINPQISLPNGNDFELDLIFQVNGCFYWIEAKTGDYQQHISKYSKITKMIGLDHKHSIMVLTDIQPDKSNALSALFSMTVYGLSQLEQGLIETIKKDIAA